MASFKETSHKRNLPTLSLLPFPVYQRGRQAELSIAVQKRTGELAKIDIGTESQKYEPAGPSSWLVTDASPGFPV